MPAALDGRGRGRRVRSRILTGLFVVVACAMPAASASAATPNTTITAGPSGWLARTKATFTFKASLSGSTFQCRLDSGAWKTCTSPRTLTSLKQGAHTFKVRAKKGSKVDASPASRAFKVDTVKPHTTITKGPSGWTFDATPSFSFTASMPGSTFQCKVDDGTYTTCTSPFTATGYSKGDSHTFRVRAKNPVGVLEPSPPSHSFTIDEDLTASTSGEFAAAAARVYLPDAIDLDVPPLCDVAEVYQVDCPAGHPEPPSPQYRLTVESLVGGERAGQTIQYTVRFLVSTISAPLLGRPEGRCQLVILTITPPTTNPRVPQAVVTTLEVAIDVEAGRLALAAGSPSDITQVHTWHVSAGSADGCGPQYRTIPGSLTAMAADAIRSAIMAHGDDIGPLCAKLGPDLLGPCD